MEPSLVRVLAKGQVAARDAAQPNAPRFRAQSRCNLKQRRPRSNWQWTMYSSRSWLQGAELRLERGRLEGRDGHGKGSCTPYWWAAWRSTEARSSGSRWDLGHVLTQLKTSVSLPTPVVDSLRIFTRPVSLHTRVRIKVTHLFARSQHRLKTSPQSPTHSAILPEPT
jgi:hypothetical protein